MLLSHTQFIENRVYDDEDDEEEASHDKTRADADVDATNDSKDPESIFVENVSLALRTSFNFIEDAFHQVEVRNLSLVYIEELAIRTIYFVAYVLIFA